MKIVRKPLEWMAAACLAFNILGSLTVSALIIHVSKQVDVQAILLFRMGAGAAMALFLMRLYRVRWVPDTYGLLRQKTMFSVLSTQATYLSITMLPLSTSTSIIHTHPVWTALLGWFFFGMRIHRSAAGAIMLCLIGTLLTSWPSPDVSSLGILLGLTGAFMSSGSLLATQRTKAFPPLQVIAHAALASASVALVLLIVQGKLLTSIYKIFTDSGIAVPIVMGAIIGCLSQLAFVIASQRIAPVASSTLRLLEIPLSLILASVLYARDFDFGSLLGAGAILLGSAFLTVYSIPLARTRTARRRRNQSTGMEPTLDISR